MGVCDSKNINTPIINIENSDNHQNSCPDPKLIKEAIFKGMPVPINDQQLKTITQQQENSICKIIKNNKSFGTGFLCSFPSEYNIRTIKALITANHVLGEEDLKVGNEIKLSFKDNNQIKIIKFDGQRHIYGSKAYDTTIIEILDDDGLKNQNFLEIEQKVFSNIDFNKEYKNKTIYILQYPKGLFSIFSYGIIKEIDENNKISHYCATESGSSGAPILNLDSLKVIGIHLGSDIVKEHNVGLIIKEPILNFNKDNQIILTLEIDKYDVGEKVYFLGHYYKKDYDKINKNNAILIINNEKNKFNYFFIPKKPGIYSIKIILTQLIDVCSHLFAWCKKIIKIDLSSFNTSKVKDMSNMFNDCNNLKELVLSSFNTSKVENMSYMFGGCSNLKELDLSSFNTSNVKDMSYMFWFCSDLKKLDLSSFNTSNVIDMTGMFCGCNNLKELDLSSFNTSNVKDMSLIFLCCRNLNLNEIERKFKIKCH